GPSPDCVACRGEQYPALVAGPPAIVVLCGRDAIQVDPPRRVPIDLGLLQQRLASAVAGLERTAHLLRFQADGCRFSVFPGGRALLFGVHDPLRARVLYDRWIGAG
ncbi:MAG TPA: thiazole biosynthesis adenylyltransferase ThiF, partial [Planctomycetota bacterium]|nr:thiazole biosynthesis adenylyltransferase ThiF [Planctomycetota bacterium]